MSSFRVEKAMSKLPSKEKHLNATTTSTTTGSMDSSVPAGFTIHSGQPSITCQTTTSSAVSPIRLRYVNEGAANVIWSIECNQVPLLENKLLRLRKGTKSAKSPQAPTPPPPFVSSQLVLEHFDTRIRPKFHAEYLVDQTLVTISEDIIYACNKVLDRLEETDVRPKKRRGWHIEHTERSGLLITSMLPRNDNASILVQLKPKWLAQSPTAPENARRCRTCALQASRATATSTLPICPLILVSGAENQIKDAMSQLPDTELAALPPSVDRDELILLLTKFFMGRGRALLSQIRDFQVQNDPHGICAMYEDISDATDDENCLQGKRASWRSIPLPLETRCPSPAQLENSAVAMSLRDCTLFMKVWKASGVLHLDAKLADLDPKSSEDESRRLQWYGTERMLIQKGWYSGTEELIDGVERYEGCLLWNATS